MSGVEIICDKMADGWNYDDCISCKHFSVSYSPGKGHQWTCSLNNKPASQKRKFRLIWTIDSLRAYGMDIEEEKVKVNYIGKRKRKPKNK